MRILALLCLLVTACGDDTGGSAGAGGTSGSGGSGGTSGSGGSAGHDAAVDAPDVDSLPMTCGNMEAGTCSASAESCQCCPIGGVSTAQHCLCTTTCHSDTDCTDLARPHCEHQNGDPQAVGFCTPNQFGCCWVCQ
jgi:hypothetical protein